MKIKKEEIKPLHITEKSSNLGKGKDGLESQVSISKLSDRTVKKKLTSTYHSDVLPIIRIFIEEANINAIREVKK